MKKKTILIILLIVIAIALSSGASFAYYRFMRGVNGPVSASANTVDGLSISFQDGEFIGTENFVPGSTVTKNFSITNENNQSANFNVYLNDVLNTITRTTDLTYGLYDSNDILISTGVFPKDNAMIANKVTIPANTTVNYHLVITYINSQEDQSADIGFTFEGTVSLVYKKPALCKRATTLHTEICNNESLGYCAEDGYALGATITYGNLGTKGTLNSGDAFDCDVNGDGTYDALTERFYYVSDMNNDTAVMIYYNNVTAGAPDNMSGFIYDSNFQDSIYYGPQIAKLQLPTTSQWKNVSLTNSVRDIKDALGTPRVENFSYEGYAARLVTTQEIENGCNAIINCNRGTTNLYSACQFLLENTQYSNNSLINGYWIENVRRSYAGDSWLMQSNHVVAGYPVDRAYGVRPVIEVPKTRIEI